ncbi:MAG: 4Fe-4S binding protein [Ignavibacteria bacterium]|nr:4Fe-4S binding protein [Ignavibacteria bacterium]
MNIDTLTQIADKYKSQMTKITRRVTICGGTGCIANGSQNVYDELVKQLALTNIDAVVDLKFEDNKDHTYVMHSGCQGFCQMGPLVTIEPDNIQYVKVKPADVSEIVLKTLAGNSIVERLLYHDPVTGQKFNGTKDIPFYARQNRTVLKNIGHIDPADIKAYIGQKGYFSAYNAWTNMTDEDICNDMITSGLRGRGGGGFPTGRKWNLTRIEKNEKKYIICNADEGDPGAFMDRSILEGNPHSVVEGMMIAARAIGANEGYIYVRTEYPLACKRIKQAINDAKNIGILGDDVFGTSNGFKITVMEGAGAFVCGEETALIASIEGKRGMPRPKPPFPAQAGLFGKPTCINNVETLSAVPLIFQNGPTWFKAIGTEKSAGTKTFAVTGNVANTGLIEVPFGTTLREIVENIGGGVLTEDGKVDMDAFKAAQIGGPSGGCLTKEHLDMPLDYETLTAMGAMVGSGGLVVMNDQTCIVQIARFFMRFTQNESCGKCTICREGTKQMLALLDDIIEGNATLQTIDLLEELAHSVKIGSLCGLGKTAPNPVLATLKYFRTEYDEHVINKRCPTKRCKALTSAEILADKCKGCRVCIKVCPEGAITGELKKPHTINKALCIKCGACAQACKFNAITGVA